MFVGSVASAPAFALGERMGEYRLYPAFSSCSELEIESIERSRHSSTSDAPPALAGLPVRKRDLHLSLLNRAIQALEQAEAKIVALEQRRDESIAIVGLGCRFPGGRSPDAFWRSLDAGIDAVSEIPESRWSMDAALGAARWAGLLDDGDVTGFDAGFFGISPREAAGIDPQQRLLLEVSVEALEDAGTPLDAVRGSRTGVFAGIMTLDYGHLSMDIPHDRLDVYASTGIGACFGSGRLSYALGLEGPSVSTDAACSSSLVALHLACQSLRSRECDLALAGGVNLLLSPWTMRLFLQMQSLSPDGRCRSFDAKSNGFVRGEGCGVTVLKRLSDALRDGDPIRALVRGSAINHNGRSSGLVAPSVPSQQALLRQALAAARSRPEDIGYVEAHGIATPLGDPIEMEALKAVLGAPREGGATCAIGSVKTNIGHLEAAAGIAGVIKTVLALEHERVPPHLHFESLNPRISLDGTALSIAERGRVWPRGEHPRRAGVSAFGLSGANAHVILEEAPAPARRSDTYALSSNDGTPQPHIVVATARSEASLRRLAEDYAEALERDDAVSLADMAHTTTVRRSHYPHRLAIVGTTRSDVASSLRRWLASASAPHARAGRASPSGAKVVFVYPERAAGRRGAARELDERAGWSPAFRGALDRCEALFAALGGWSLPAVLRDAVDARPEVLESAHFALQIALTAEWQACGVVPDRVLGRGIGEIAAAHAAGVVSLETAAELIWRRGDGACATAAAQIPLYSSATGGRVSGDSLIAAYRVHRESAPERFGEALDEATVGEPTVVVEVSARQAPGTPRRALLESLGDVFVAGGAVAWERGPEAGGRLAPLPTYAWDRSHHWIDRSEHTERAVAPKGELREANAPVATDPHESPLLVQTWEKRDEDTGEVAPASGRWLLVSDRADEGRGARLAASLRAIGQTVALTSWGEELEITAIDAALNDVFADGDGRGIVVHVAADAPERWADGAAAQASVEARAWQVVQLVQAVARRRWKRSPPRLWLLTESAQSIPANDAACDSPVSLGGAALWGLGRTIGIEHPELRCARIDVERESPAELVARELLGDSADDELGLRDSSWYVARLAWIDHPPRSARREPARGRPVRLELDRPGILDHLTYRVRRGSRLAPGEVRVRVESAGLNFMDVMTAMGIYPGADGGGSKPIVLGGECSGRVDAVGPGVLGFAVGDPVVAVGKGCFASYVTTDAAYVQRRPAELEAVAAGGVPIVFLTAWYALMTLGRLQEGERVLIHSAATGVGLAAVQIARWRGARVYATAGSEEKRAYLRAMGVVRVMDSRTQAFASEVLEATRGEGVDVVLNSLSGASIESSLAALASDGRFFEIGKTDIYGEGRALDLSPFRKRISYQAVDLLGFARERKDRFAALFAEVMGAFRAGVLTPLPTELVETADTGGAFRRMASGQHLGKIVVKMGDADVPVEASVGGGAVVDEDASYLVTGGLGVFGVALAEWLVEEGARRVVLAGRRGLGGAAASVVRRVDALRARGVELRICEADVSRADDVARIVAEAETMGPLRGVAHAAAVHGDAPLCEQTRAGLSAAMAPKVAGAWNLHHATSGKALDFFALFSSSSALLGAPGQAHEAAANAFLDGLAAYRQRRGLVASSVQWGPFMADADGERALVARGIRSLGARDGWAALRALLDAGSVQACVIRLNARHLIEYVPHIAGMARFTPLLTSRGEARGGGDHELLARMARATDAERLALVEGMIRAELAQVLRADPARIEHDIPFKALGLDSLMGLELRNRIEAALPITLSSALIWAYPDLRRLGAYLVGRIALPSTDEPKGDEPNGDERRLSHDEKSALLERELESFESLLN